MTESWKYPTSSETITENLTKIFLDNLKTRRRSHTLPVSYRMLFLVTEPQTKELDIDHIQVAEHLFQDGRHLRRLLKFKEIHFRL